MCNPISEYNEELYAFRRLSPRERIEQLTLKLETDDDFVAKFKDAFDQWEKQRDSATKPSVDEVKAELYDEAQQEESETRKSMYKFLLHGSCGVTDK